MKDVLAKLGAAHLWVYLHLVHGPNNHVTGLYRISPAQIAEDTDLDTDEVRKIISELADTGWCDYEAPLIWIRGIGDINDQLGTTDFKRGEKWLKATMNHISDLPNDHRMVVAFCRFHGLDLDTLSIPHPCRISYSSPPASSCASSSSSTEVENKLAEVDSAPPHAGRVLR
jgi:hypothetical protein